MRRHPSRAGEAAAQVAQPRTPVETLLCPVLACASQPVRRPGDAAAAGDLAGQLGCRVETAFAQPPRAGRDRDQQLGRRCVALPGRGVDEVAEIPPQGELVAVFQAADEVVDRAEDIVPAFLKRLELAKPSEAADKAITEKF